MRRVSDDGIVDTSAVLLTLPQELVRDLGLRERESEQQAGPRDRGQTPSPGRVTVRIGDRQTTMDCVVGPPQREPVIGSTVLATVDLAADEATGTVRPGRGARDRGAYRGLKSSARFTRIATGSPKRVPGSKSHCRAALTASSSSPRSSERVIRTSPTVPSGSTTILR